MDLGVNIAIPTYNRASLLKLSLASALAQDYTNLIITVLDNASPDDTESVVKSFEDSRIHYIRHETNIGMLRNWNAAIATNTQPYLVLLQDDDLLLPSHITKSVTELEQYPNAGFCFTDAIIIDEHGEIIDKHPNRKFASGLSSGVGYLRRVVDINSSSDWRDLSIQASSVLMRTSALDEVGGFDAVHTKTTIEYNLYFRLAAHNDIAYIPEKLAQIRLHENADHLQSEVRTRSLGMLAERCDAAVSLMRSDMAQGEEFRNWLAEKMSLLQRQKSEIMASLLPDYGLSRIEKIGIASDEISRLVPADQSMMLIDENELVYELQVNRHMRPFTEKDGQFWGAPQNDDIARMELIRMCEDGINFIIILWPAFWYLDVYRSFSDCLHSQFYCLLKNSRLMAFQLRS